MIVKIEAYIREDKMEDVIDALATIDIHGITCYQVMGCGSQHGVKEYTRGKQEVELHLLPKIKIEVLLSTEKCEQRVIDTIQKTAYTGEKGDGKILSYDVRSAMRIRTHETGPEAIQPSD